MTNQSLGKRGEDLCVSYLQNLHYLILDRNFRSRNGEIDIIALSPDKKELVFIEVKTRRSTEYGYPLEAVTYFKMKALIRTAQLYKSLHKKLPVSLRIDAIAIILNSDNTILTFEHQKNITL